MHTKRVISLSFYDGFLKSHRGNANKLIRHPFSKTSGGNYHIKKELLEKIFLESKANSNVNWGKKEKFVEVLKKLFEV